MNKYGEPWESIPNYVTAPAGLHTRDGDVIADFNDKDHAMRARACVNTLAGVPDPEALVQAAREAEQAMDRLNGDTGTKSRPCSFCRAQEYNAQVGIEHDALCPILGLRTALGGEYG